MARTRDGLTVNQRKFIDRIAMPEKKTVAGVCREIGITRQSYYNWMNESETFKNAVENATKSWGEAHLPEAWEALMESIQEDRNPQSIKLYFELMGQLEKKVTVSGIPAPVIIRGEDQLED